MNNWSELRSFDEITDYSSYGVYKVHLCKSDKSPVCIPRFVVEDKSGILMIGKSKNIRRRLKYFRGAKNEKPYSHAEGKRLSIIKRKCPKFISEYKDCKLFYCYKELNSNEEMDREEERLLKCYFKNFGEVPPLNNNLPNRDKWEYIKCKGDGINGKD